MFRAKRKKSLVLVSWNGMGKAVFGTGDMIYHAL